MIAMIRRIPFFLWRLWFGILAMVPILILFPLLFILVIIPKGYPYLFWIARNIWAPFILFGMGFYLKRTVLKHPFEWDKTHMLVANHTSYIDILVMFRMWKKPFVFVGKKELGDIPLFGSIYKRAAILVDRSDPNSRFAVYAQVDEVVAKGYSVCIFPEVNYLDESILLNPFKQGAFKLAINHQIPIVPMVFLDCKRKYPWYTTHGYPGVLRVEMHEPILTMPYNMEEVQNLSDKVFTKINERLLNDPKQAAIKAIEVWKKVAI